MTVLGAWLREAADEIDKAHAYLSAIGIPETSSDGVELTLAARIAFLSRVLDPSPHKEIPSSDVSEQCS